MHYFKTEGILLSQKKLTEKEILYKILFKEYGILSVKKLKKTREKELDTGYILSCEIISYEDSKNRLPSIANIKVKNFFRPDGKKYDEIIQFLMSISYVEKCLPVGLPHSEIYRLGEYMLIKQDELTALSHILLRLKIRSYNGELVGDHRNPDITKILKFIQRGSVPEILRLKTVPLEIHQILKTLI